MSVWRFGCPSCGAVLKISNPSLAGKAVTCPKCAERVALPPTFEAAVEEPRVVEAKVRQPDRDENDSVRNKKTRAAASDRPRRKRPAKSSSGGLMRTMIGLG